MTDTEPLIARLRAALKFIGPTDITPMGVRMLEKILDEEEGKNSPGQPIPRDP